VVFRVDRAGATAAGMTIARREVVQITRRVYNRANVLTPVDTGRLRAGNQMRVRQTGAQVVGEVFNDVDYGPPVHDGTPARIVRPRRRRALRFVAGGQVVFAAWARLPARRGRPWIYRAMVEVAGRVGWTVTRV
jgi:hypothetical protein